MVMLTSFLQSKTSGGYEFAAIAVVNSKGMWRCILALVFAFIPLRGTNFKYTQVHKWNKVSAIKELE